MVESEGKEEEEREHTSAEWVQAPHNARLHRWIRLIVSAHGFAGKRCFEESTMLHKEICRQPNK
jgi:hypothetical protein